MYEKVRCPNTSIHKEDVEFHFKDAITGNIYFKCKKCGTLFYKQGG